MILQKDMLVPVCHCLCKLAVTMSEVDRAETLGACLELLYNRLTDENPHEASLILETLGVVNNNNEKQEEWTE